MAKQGMKRFDPKRDKNDAVPVPKIHGKAKHGHRKALPLIPGGEGKVYHGVPHSENIPTAFRGIDNDLAAENMVNDFDMTMADLQDLEE